MKKHLTLAIFLVLAVVLVSPFSVSAKTKAGVKSGSFFYFFDKTFEKANLFFTFNPEKKAKKALENAEERLAEAEELASENKLEAVKTAMENYQKNIEVLEKVLVKVPEEAKQAIEKAIEADKERREEMTKKIEEINNEIKNEDNDFKKDEEEKSNDDVGDNESDEEENGNENKDENKKDEQKKEIDKLKKEVETLKQITPKQPTLEIQNSQEQKKTEEASNNAEETTKKLQVEIQRIEEDFAKLLTEKEDLTAISQQPRLISFKDNLGNIYIEKKDFVRKASEPFNHGFGISYTPLCLQGISAINENCQSEIINWVNNRSVEIGKHLNITLDSFDANGDDVFYYISYGGRKDWGYGNMRVLQSWGTNKTFSFPVTEQLYNETLFENLGWSSTFFETETRKYYDKNVKLNNAGELNIQVCFNDKAEKMIDPLGEQFPDGCILFKYFILKPGYSKLITSTQSQ